MPKLGDYLKIKMHSKLKLTVECKNSLTFVHRLLHNEFPAHSFGKILIFFIYLYMQGELEYWRVSEIQLFMHYHTKNHTQSHY